jgi:class 3 adenylate cyclase/alpha-beta hydrolase superfamily lysophospholipase
MDVPIQFCTTSDGLRIAYMVSGEGPPLVRVMGFVTNLELDRHDAIIPGARLGVVPGFQMIRFDKRGTGLSDRGIIDFSTETRVRDLEAVVDALRLKKFYLLGVSESGPIAMTYAAEHPRRVVKLALYGTLAYGGGENPQRQALATLIRTEWGMGSDAVSGIMVPGATAEERAHVARYERAAANAEDAARMVEVAALMDVRQLLPRIKAPTIVIHAKGDKAIPFDASREIAGSIPGARLIPLESDRHAPTLDGADQINEMIRSFFMGEEPAARKTTSPGLRTVLFTDLVGHTEMMRRLGDDRGREVLREHERITRDLLKRHGGAEVKTMGDGFMASFSSVTKAMDCAIALQRAFAAHEGEPLEVRVGLNAGEPIEEDGDLFGSTVIMASRIASKARAGEILIPEPLRHLLTGKSYVYADRGETMLKGFDDAVRLYEVRWRD